MLFGCPIAVSLVTFSFSSLPDIMPFLYLEVLRIHTMHFPMTYPPVITDHIDAISFPPWKFTLILADSMEMVMILAGDLVSYSLISYYFLVYST